MESISRSALMADLAAVVATFDALDARRPPPLPQLHVIVARDTQHRSMDVRSAARLLPLYFATEQLLSFEDNALVSPLIKSQRAFTLLGDHRHRPALNL